MKRSFLIFALAACLSGCFTPKVADAISEAGRQRVETVQTQPLSLVSAVRSRAGVTYLSASYSDGKLRRFTYDPLQPAGQRLTQSGRVAPEGATALSLSAPAPGHKHVGGCAMLTGSDVVVCSQAGTWGPRVRLPDYKITTRTPRSPTSVAKQIAYLTVGIPIALVCDATLGALYVTFCTEAGWRAIAAVLTCLFILR